MPDKAADLPSVSLVVDGKPVELSADVRPQLVQRSVDLLASSAFINAKPNWGAPTEPQTITDAQKQSHMHLVFSSPGKVEAPIVMATVQAREMVITLPLTAAGIWVRTDGGVLYFAKFKHTQAESLQKVLNVIQKP